MIVNDFKRMVKAFLKGPAATDLPAPAPIADPPGTAERLERDRASARKAGMTNAILHASADAYFRCVLNDCPLLLPRDMLRTMVHCIEGDVSGPLRLFVETAHYNWLASKVRGGDVFLDVGAAIGTMALPMAKHPLGVSKVIAFEPALTANRRLREVITYNQIANIEVADFAVSDCPGTASFSEYDFDETGVTPYLPETSAITSSMIDPSRSRSYEVTVTTIDAFLAGRSEAALAKVMKIDVEGFEVHVLEGALNFLRAVKPHIAIDIHSHPFQVGTTEAPVRELLDTVGYRFENRDHVLLCTPA